MLERKTVKPGPFQKIPSPEKHVHLCRYRWLRPRPVPCRRPSASLRPVSAASSGRGRPVFRGGYLALRRPPSAGCERTRRTGSRGRCAPVTRPSRARASPHAARPEPPEHPGAVGTAGESSARYGLRGVAGSREAPHLGEHVARPANESGKTWSPVTPHGARLCPQSDGPHTDTRQSWPRPPAGRRRGYSPSWMLRLSPVGLYGSRR